MGRYFRAKRFKYSCLKYYNYQIGLKEKLIIMSVRLDTNMLRPMSIAVETCYDCDRVRWFERTSYLAVQL